jgi:multidrug resistance efflux pump
VTWATVPRWLYENDLPDEHLQEFYVKAAHKKLNQLLQERAALDAQITEAEAFLARATDALARYRKGPPRGP